MYQVIVFLSPKFRLKIAGRKKTSIKLVTSQQLPLSSLSNKNCHANNYFTLGLILLTSMETQKSVKPTNRFSQNYSSIFFFFSLQFGKHLEFRSTFSSNEYCPIFKILFHKCSLYTLLTFSSFPSFLIVQLKTDS